VSSRWVLPVGSVREDESGREDDFGGYARMDSFRSRSEHLPSSNKVLDDEMEVVSWWG